PRDDVQVEVLLEPHRGGDVEGHTFAERRERRAEELRHCGREHRFSGQVADQRQDAADRLKLVSLHEWSQLSYGRAVAGVRSHSRRGAELTRGAAPRPGYPP